MKQKNIDSNNVNSSENSTKKTFKKTLSELLELPEDIILDITKSTIIGNNKITFENFKSIKEYSSGEIILNTKEGFIHLTGQNFLIKRISTEMITICGTINTLSFNNF